MIVNALTPRRVAGFAPIGPARTPRSERPREHACALPRDVTESERTTAGRR
ncbi:hypothetical protein BN159_5574 [Streptomyces davaonensis JCM 4913]|uniref:Uncharacterized protein n=1 Tax=Streptomyces davaonensis (strain DSM 101723 / JCM 4913 / KCC S-0913 / 768) TaxID=1214101 RepID=K4R9D5_STRDJ|nr:hypothetical protein BN159_5574 [Streptomyces davaonensis JCM 4913]